MPSPSRQQDSFETLRTKLRSIFGERKTEAFLVILRSGKITAADVAKKLMHIPRASTYDVLDSLQRIGIVSVFEEGGKKYFQVENVENTLTQWQHKRNDIETKENALRSLATTINQLKAGVQYRPSTRFFEGKNGILTILREIQDARKETRTIVDIAAVSKTFPYIFAEDNLSNFKKYKVVKKDLIIKSREAERYLQVAPLTQYHTVKWLPAHVTFHTDTLMWDGHVAIIDYSTHLSGVIIDNPSIYETFHAWFEMMWAGLPEMKK